MDFFSKLDDSQKQLFYYAIAGFFLLLLIIGLIVLGLTLNKKARANGASWLQIYTGKPIGAICANNGMCSTNKCVNNVCLI